LENDIFREFFICAALVISGGFYPETSKTFQKFSDALVSDFVVVLIQHNDHSIYYTITWLSKSNLFISCHLRIRAAQFYW